MRRKLLYGLVIATLATIATVGVLYFATAISDRHLADAGVTLGASLLSGVVIATTLLVLQLLLDSEAERRSLAIELSGQSALMGIDLRSKNLSGFYLRDKNLESSNLADADLSDSSLAKSSLRKADVSGAKLVGVAFGDADLRALHAGRYARCWYRPFPRPSASFRDASLNQVNLTGARLPYADFRGSSFVSARVEFVRDMGLNQSIAPRTKKSRGAMKGMIPLKFHVEGISDDESLSEAERERKVEDHVDRNLRTIFVGAEFRHAAFTVSTFDGCDFTRSSFRSADCGGATYFISCLFTDARMRGVDMSRNILWGASFLRADLRHANFAEANLAGAFFGQANLRHATFDAAHARYIEEGRFIDIDATHEEKRGLINYVELKLGLDKVLEYFPELADRPDEVNDLRIEQLLKEIFARGIPLDFTGADLSRARMSGVVFPGGRFLGARLNGAHLENAVLPRATLNCADLRGSHLEHVDLRGADLQGATLSGASLSNVNLSFANVGGVDFTTCDLNECVFNDVRSDAATKLPATAGYVGEQ
jgi:uncharacterized protein YjbI with pentapeptide repeats